LRRNNQQESYPAQYFRSDTNGAGPSAATWQQRGRQDILLNGTGSDNSRNGQAVSVPPFDWQASEALMKCYNG
jgi:hypothetical protein